MLPALLRNSRCNWACSGEMHEACLAGLWVVPAASHSQLLAANRCHPWAGERVSAARGGILHPCPLVWSVYWQTKGHLQSKGKGMTVNISKQDTDLPSQKREPNQNPPGSWPLFSALPQTYFCNIRQSLSTYLSLLCKLLKRQQLPLKIAQELE